MKSYPVDKMTINNFVKNYENLFKKPGPRDIAEHGKEKAKQVHTIYKKITSSALGKTLLIIGSIIAFLVIILIILGIAQMLDIGNPIGMIKLVIMIGLFFAVYILLSF